MNKHTTVALTRAEAYDFDKIKNIFASHFEALGITRDFFAGKKVAIKPNLVMKKAPEAAATTNPVTLDALLSLLSDMGVTPIIAESPGGIYSRARLESIYRVCGIEAVAKKYGDILNFDVSSKRVSFADGKVCHEFEMITPLYEADIIIDLCKLKSHSLTKMSAAVKNFFGSVPGIVKFEMHSAYPENERFCGMICDLCKMICEQKSVIAVTDAIIGMEGNGPTGGEPRKIGALLTSLSPFASDIVSEKLLGFEGTVPMVNEFVSRGYIAREDIDIIGDDIDSLVMSDFKEPDSTQSAGVNALGFFSQGWIGNMLAPRPLVNRDKCRGCAECFNSCPQKTIVMKEKKGKRIAFIEREKCIRCFCCQELCPFTAIDTKKHFVLKIVNAIK